MSKASDIFGEVTTIVEAHRIETAMVAEALIRRSDSLAALAIADISAVDMAIRTSAVTHLYSSFAAKIDLVLNNTEQAEAVIRELENDDAYDNGNNGTPGGSGSV